MTITLFTEDWEFLRAGQDSGTIVRLPHDAMIGEPRSADAATGNHGGYFPGGAYVYRKRWTPPPDDREHAVVFEGVQGHARVLVDGREVARCDNGYREFRAPLTDVAAGSEALIEVQVDNTDVPNSRWYTGSGIYRPVWLHSVATTRVAPDGIRISTRSLDKAAIVDVTIQVEGPTTGATATVEFLRGGSLAAQHAADVTSAGTATVELRIEDPHPWSADTPDLYDVAVAVTVDGETVDERTLRTGLRTVTVSPRAGLRINGMTTLLRGAAVHHDNGLIGAATFAAAEHRRARLLKQAGFNAVRSAHNPLSRAFLDACDEVGLYVMDELTDVWLTHKTPHDDADRFPQEWRADAASMIAKDRNHPSVIMYSIGNEIADSARPAGVEMAKTLSRFFADQDPTRPTTLAVNLLLNMMASRGSSPFSGEHYSGNQKSNKPKKRQATSTAANLLTAKLGRIMEFAARLPAADKASRDAFATVDIAGYNYAYGRYAADRRRYPGRVIVGSESMPGDLPSIWSRVTSVPGVIGDFMWTGWDYLGEAGIGTWSYDTEPGGINKPYPYVLAGCGAFDITGQPGAAALLARAVWDPHSAPGIAVRPMDRTGQRANKTPWRFSDAISSWAWRGYAGTAEIEVYSPDDHVELLLNGRSLGRKRAGRRARYVTRFRTIHEPGELVAIGYRDGNETGRSSLRSAETVSLTVRAETHALHGPDDLAYVWIELADHDGVVDMHAADEITVTVTGSATLAGLGSAAPDTTETFTGPVRASHRGRILAILRGGDASGEVLVTATSRRHGTATLTLTVEAPRTDCTAYRRDVREAHA